METTKLKRFATEARINLMEGVKRKLRLLGYDERGNAVSEPQLVQGATLWKGEEFPEDFYNQWKTLQQRLLEKGLREVAEEAAYTWFNRMMAIRILSMNGFCEPILRIDPSTGLPNLLANARMGRIPEMSAQQRHRLDILMDDDTKSYEQFALLLTAWCHDNPIINACFGSINDYVELLLPDNILRPDGFISLLNETDFITEEDYKSAELIGWLYQFYISERKDEVFAKKGKIEAEEIPAATQIFTPNWIVKYMVHNTILPQVDAPEEIIEKAKYLVKVEGADNHKKELEDLKVADFACGSGHILNECFDLLFELYRSEAYSRKEAVEYIFTKNLTGIDIDLRAKQLATFALLLKACQKDESFIDAHCLPKILTIPDKNFEIKNEKLKIKSGKDKEEFINIFLNHNSFSKDAKNELIDAFKILEKVDSLGSIIKFKISPSTRRQIVETIEHYRKNDPFNSYFLVFNSSLDFILTLTDTYTALCMNPPYFVPNKNNELGKYAKENYPNSCADMATVFIEVMANRSEDKGNFAFIIPPSWMFLSGFQKFRKELIDNYSIQSLLHLSRGVFGADFGASSAVIKKTKNGDFKGTYFRLIERTFQEFDQKHLKELFEKVLENHEFKYLFKNYSKDLESIEYSEEGAKIYYDKVDQKRFEEIPGYPIVYWVSEKLLNYFNNSNFETFTAAQGMATCDNNRFLRFWSEIDNRKLCLSCKNSEEAKTSGAKWFPYNKGGGKRRWYGNQYYVINWENNGKEVKDYATELYKNASRTIKNEFFYFRPSISWSDINIGSNAYRLYPAGFIFDVAGMSCFVEGSIYNLLGILNTNFYTHLAFIINPTMHFQVGDFRKFPFQDIDILPFESIVKNNIEISKEDWDSNETSWDFSTNSLVENTKCQIKNRKYGIKDALKDYKEKWNELFFQLHGNEEELNRQFIEIYGFQDELTPEVPLDEITILQQGEIKIEDGKIKWNDDVIIKQLISYIVGVYMGRYRLDKPGLHIAYPEPSEEDLAKYQIPDTEYQLEIDPDAIIPVLPKDAPFYDNLYNYVVEFIGKVWGQNELTENLNFIEKALGKSLDDYLMKDFWKDHKKMYQNRPIYWEFASKKGAFKAIIYAHRMDKYTIEVLRSKYILPYIKFIENKISNLESREQELSTKERRELDNLRTKILPELEEYHSRVEQVAAETAARPQVFDLDDGIPHNHSLFGDIVTKLK